MCVCVPCVPADERVAGLIPQGLSASGWLLLIWTTMTHTPILRRLCVCVCVRVCFSWSRFHHVFLLFWLHSSEQLHFKSTSFLGGSCLTPRVFFGHCGSQLSQNAFHTPPAAEWRCFVFPSRDCQSISEDSSSCRAEFRASTFTLRINQIDPVNRIRADWYSVNRHNLRAWARVSVLQVQCDRY